MLRFLEDSSQVVQNFIRDTRQLLVRLTTKEGLDLPHEVEVQKNPRALEQAVPRGAYASITSDGLRLAWQAPLIYPV